MKQHEKDAQNSANATTQCLAYQQEIALLLNLLAVIHRDGGHHTLQFGVLQSAKEAEAAICRERVECSELREQLEQERKRLDTVAYYGAALRRDPKDGKWYVIVPFHSGISSVDSLIRFDTAREAIDNLVAAEAAGGVK